MATADQYLAAGWVMRIGCDVRRASGRGGSLMK
jgi:hypothetical protein